MWPSPSKHTSADPGGTPPASCRDLRCGVFAEDQSPDGLITVYAPREWLRALVPRLTILGGMLQAENAIGITWYLRSVAKTQINIRMDDDTAEMARHAAETRRIPVNEYVEQLIRNDNEQVRAVFMAAAQEVLDEYGDLLDEIEGEQEEPRT
ncbi:hypothetical protein GCM10023084_18860 [Streptomyces lacrimifluminis]|uniref:Uncharacterized protein n=1 Tax=Streptomyces lacrimifluminis TaxID=1500077 RepID=A0A917NLE2_9ACTN|nr:hypothetical protein GCM10012282_03230 [Streptomyces lacrimifluminis]